MGRGSDLERNIERRRRGRYLNFFFVNVAERRDLLDLCIVCASCASYDSISSLH
jgi:hypothetical protein